MKMTLDLEAISDVVRKVWSYASTPSNEFRFMGLGADENGGKLIATDRFSLVEISFPAKVEEPGLCMLGEHFARLMGNIPPQEITFKLNNNTLSIKGSDRFVGRLQVLNNVTIDGQKVKDKLALINYTTNVVFFRHEINTLIKLSESFPPAEGAQTAWITFHINGETAFGSTQETELGFVENFPLNILSIESSEPGIFVANTSIFKSLTVLCGDQVSLQLSNNSRDMMLITDPTNPSWWAAMAAIAPKTKSESNEQQE